MTRQVLAPYFFTRPDPQKGRHPRDPQNAHYASRGRFPPAAWELIRPFCESAARMGLFAVIFHDGLGEEFIRAHKGEHLDFQKVCLGARSVNDERFLAYRRYLAVQPEIREVFMTDLFDVDFLADPFRLLDPRFDIFVGSEETYSYFWMRALYRKTYGRMHHQNRRLLNAGILGGTRKNVLMLLDRMAADMAWIPSRINANMAVLNKCVYDLFPRERIFTGYPLHSRYKQYEQTGGFAIRHK